MEEKILKLQKQLNDLAKSLDELKNEVKASKRTWTEWKPYGMYNGEFRTNGKQVVCRRITNTSVTGRASCMPGDIFSLSKGLDLASMRLKEKEYRIAIEKNLNNINSLRIAIAASLLKL